MAGTKATGHLDANYVRHGDTHNITRGKNTYQFIGEDLDRDFVEALFKTESDGGVLETFDVIGVDDPPRPVAS
jgi:hypothetical protein